jgi:hypothetical protein
VFTAAVIDLGMGHATHDGDLVSNLCAIRHMGTEIDPGNCGCNWREDTSVLGGSIRFGVKAIHVGKATLKVDVNYRFGFCLRLTVISESLKVKVLSKR